MDTKQVLATIDSQISALKLARAALTAATDKPTPVPAPTRKKRKKKSKLSAEGRKKIAEAQKKRWAAQKKATS